MGNFNAGIDDVVDVYVRVVAVADTDDVSLFLHVFVFLNCHAIFGMLCHPNSALTCPMFLCQRSLRAALLA